MQIAFLKGPQYGLLQKISYSVVLFFLLPVIVLTGLTMSPAVSASCPFLLTMFFWSAVCTYHSFLCVGFAGIVLNNSYCYDHKIGI
jgi:thiosulfate reductase cytochrome b subunit